MSPEKKKGKKSAGAGPGKPASRDGPLPDEPGASLISAEELIEGTLFGKDKTLVSKIEKDFNESLMKNKRQMTFLIILIIGGMGALLFTVGVMSANPDRQYIGAVLATLLSLGTGIQVGTMAHTRISKQLNKEIEAVNDLMMETNQSLTQMDFIVTEVLKKTSPKANEEIINEIKIKNVNQDITSKELSGVMRILARKKEITQPPDRYTVLIVDIPEREIREYLGEEYVGRVTRIGQSNLGYKSLLYLRHEFTAQKLKEIKQNNPTLRRINMDSFLEAGTKLVQELGKLGISYKDISDETKVWITKLSGHERRELVARIKRLKADTQDLYKKLTAQEEKFKDIKSILDTTIAVLLLAGAGIVGFFIDMLF